MRYSDEDHYYMVNSLGHCWKCKQPGHVRINCLKLGQSRTSYRRRKDEDVCCYNCNKCGHYSRDCLVPKRMRKEHGSRGVEDKVKSILWEVMQKINRKLEDFAAEETKEDKVKSILWEVMQKINRKLEDSAAKETKEEPSISSSICGVHSENVTPGENHLFSNVCSLQH